MPSNVILTPHPGELARLLTCSTEAVLADLPAAATECWSRYGATVVAKTTGAVVVGRHLAYIDAGDPGMATAGSGDVLAGIIGAFAARFSPDTAAELGAWVHSTGGAIAAQRTTSPSLIASNIIHALPDVFALLES
jgi:NAD(P)H-hydrate repair Nnr-like enzyme with NAD(P)H-hydrate dehydratase domain